MYFHSLPTIFHFDIHKYSSVLYNVEYFHRLLLKSTSFHIDFHDLPRRLQRTSFDLHLYFPLYVSTPIHPRTSIDFRLLPREFPYRLPRLFRYRRRPTCIHLHLNPRIYFNRPPLTPTSFRISTSGFPLPLRAWRSRLPAAPAEGWLCICTPE